MEKSILYRIGVTLVFFFQSSIEDLVEVVRNRCHSNSHLQHRSMARNYQYDLP
jgi:hypothetical protein